jgi:Secretion system C-terminal sorting domain/Abnormal spindle-like microcephaly-assoc'd, ASPM-SPD-2-Hydin
MALFIVTGLSAGTGTSAKGPALWISSVHADTTPTFLVTPSDIDFGAVIVSEVFAETVTVTNSSAKILFISSVTVDSGEFSVTPNFATVDPFGSAIFVVSFAPTVIGDQSGNVVFVHNGATSPDLLPLLGTGTPDTDVEDETPLPKQFALQGNYPNPFNPTTRIVFDLPKATVVSLTIYNALGAQVAEILDQAAYEPGTHELQFNGANLASGIYFYRLRTPEFNSVKKMVLLK